MDKLMLTNASLLWSITNNIYICVHSCFFLCMVKAASMRYPYTCVFYCKIVGIWRLIKFTIKMHFDHVSFVSRLCEEQTATNLLLIFASLKENYLKQYFEDELWFSMPSVKTCSAVLDVRNDKAQGSKTHRTASIYKLQKQPYPAAANRIQKSPFLSFTNLFE